MKRLLFILLSFICFSARAQWYNIATNQDVSSTDVGHAVDSSYYNQLRPFTRTLQILKRDSVSYFIGIDPSNSYFYNKIDNQTIAKRDLTSRIFNCGDSVILTPTILNDTNKVVGFYAGTVNKNLLFVCDSIGSNGTGLVGNGIITWFYGYTKIGGFANATVDDTNLTIPYTYNSSIGPYVFARYTYLCPPKDGAPDYNIFNICSTTNTITFTETNSTYLINAASPLAGTLVISGLSSAGFTNSNCSTSSGYNSTQSGSSTIPIGHSGNSNISCSSCLNTSTSPYYEMGSTVVINGVTYYSGNTFTINGQTITVSISSSCAAL